MYDEVAQYYDWEHEGFAEDVHLYLDFAAASKGEILDAACGTGRVLLPLARSGYAVTGVDSSPAMLAIARDRLRAEAPRGRVRLICEDIRSLALHNRFGMALVALGSFHHLTSLASQRGALEGLAAILSPHGLLILDLLNPTPEWIAAADGALVHLRTAPFPQDNAPQLLSKFVARSGTFETQTDGQLLLYDLTARDGTVTRRAIWMELRYLFRYEVELLLGLTGFRVRDLYGTYDLDPYAASSPRMIFVAERT